MSKKIEFACEFDHVELPKPAKGFVPDWYKKAPKWEHGTPNVQQIDKGLKHCVPFLDGMTNGYMVTLWQDIEVRIVDGFPKIFWPIPPAVIDVRTQRAFDETTVPYGHNLTPFVWKVPFSIKVPKGYSLLATHPVNRYDLPFTTLSALVDADGGMYPGNAPFFIREGFEGIIPMGTPIMQLIPVKRESWKSSQNKALVEEGRLWDLTSRRVVSGAYKALKWKKKDFQ